jgi:hypothetical protein
MWVSPSPGLYLHTEKHKHRIHAHNTDIYALSGIRAHDPRVRASEDSSCLTPRRHRLVITQHVNSVLNPESEGAKHEEWQETRKKHAMTRSANLVSVTKYY